MALNDDLDKSKQSADEAKKSVEGLGNAVDDVNDKSGKLADNFDKIEQQSKKLNDLGSEYSAVFGSISDALAGLAKNSKEFKNEISDARTTQKSLAANAQKLASFTKDNLKDRVKMNDFAKAAAKVAADRAKTESTIRILTAKRVNATKAEKAIIDKTVENLRNSLDYAGGIADGFEEITDANDELNKNTKFFDNLESTLKTIPGLGPAIAGPFAKASKAVRDARVDGEGLGMSLAKGGNEIAKSFGPAFFLGSLFKANTETFNLAKTLGISADEARDMRDEFTAIAVESGKSYLNAEKLQGAMMELGDELGAQLGFTDEQIKAQVMLTKKMGLSSKEAANINKFSVLTGEDTRDITAGILDNVTALEKETGIRLDGRKIVQQVAKIEGQLGAQYGFNAKALAKAVIQAQKLGLTLEETKNISEQLLDFESSIEAEMEAELMTGRSLNLEQARLLALQGKSAEAVEEMASQFGSAEEFASMNVLQQNSLAKAVGMTADQLANSIRERETLKALGASSIEQALKEGKSRDEIIAAGGEQLLQQYEQQAAAEKFQDAVVKIQSAIGTLVEGPLGAFIDRLGDILNSGTAIKGIMVAIGAVTTANMAKTILSIGTSIALQKKLNRDKAKDAALSAVSTGAEAGKSVAKIPFVGGFLAIGLIAAVTGYILGKLSAAKAGDVMSPAQGRTMVSTKEGGLFELSKNDDLVAAPGAASVLTNVSNNNRSSTSNVNVSMDRLEQLQSQTNSILSRLLNKNASIKMDSEDLGTAVSLNNYEISA